jgi:hypothetical protein
VREAESISNSIRFYGNNVFNDEYSQVLEVGSHLTNREGVKVQQLVNKESIGEKGLVSSKLFDDKKTRSPTCFVECSKVVKKEKQFKMEKEEKRIYGTRKHIPHEREIRGEEGKLVAVDNRANN